MKQLKGNLIALRALEPADIDLLYEWENDTSIWRLGDTIVPFSKFLLEKYIAEAHLDIYATKQLRLIIESLENGMANHPLGCIDLFDFCPVNLRAGVGILIAKPSERKNGYASEALRILIDYAFSTLCLNQLYCNIAIENEPSIRLFKKFGFEKTGIKKAWTRHGKQWQDEYMFQLINA